MNMKQFFFMILMRTFEQSSGLETTNVLQNESEYLTREKIVGLDWIVK